MLSISLPISHKTKELIVLYVHWEQLVRESDSFLAVFDMSLKHYSALFHNRPSKMLPVCCPVTTLWCMGTNKSEKV